MTELHYKIKEVGQLKSGNIILHPVYRNDGLLLINSYKTLTPSIINHISKQFLSDTPFLVVETEASLRYFLSDKIYEDMEFLKNLNKIKEMHQMVIGVPITDEAFSTGSLPSSSEKELPPKEDLHQVLVPLFQSPLWSSLEKVFDSPYIQKRALRVKKRFEKTLANETDLLYLLNKMKEYHDTLYIHAINSTGIALLFGLALELDDQNLIDLGVASMFADVGFTNFETKKYIRYLDDGKKEIELLNGHIKQSVEMISHVKIATKKSIISGILDHHEYVNGNGHPFRKKQNQISLFGKIIAISQAYDEKLGGYISETSIPALKAQYYIWSERGKRFDSHIINAFVYRSSLYRIGQVLTLPNQKTGLIIGFENYAEEPLLPIVKLKNHETINFYHLRSSLS